MKMNGVAVFAAVCKNSSAAGFIVGHTTDVDIFNAKCAAIVNGEFKYSCGVALAAFTWSDGITDMTVIQTLKLVHFVANLD